MWIAATSVIALVLSVSQLPIIKQIIKGIKVKVGTPEFFVLYHFMGNIQMNIFLDIHNNGGETIYFKVNCIIKDSDGNQWELPAHTRYITQPTQSGTSQQELMIGLISLQPEEHWSETIHCFKIWTEAEEEQANEIITKIRRDISVKLPLKPPNVQLIEADANLVTEAKDFFNRKFNLHRGNYQLFIALLSESDKMLCVRTFDFTLFESNILALKAHTEDYKYGAGIYFSIPDQTKYVFARIRPIRDEQAHELYKRLRTH